ncbi:DUF6088 family protein [Pseudomonas aeruginosa]|uniref:DUF6088 family protein n=1 Tax=Pseudomonas aeruginosa TaxID=287 RepID=UPI0012DAAA6D|nr:DUF6088 family protein [Pseudomonas aeruginosa]MUI17116.1 hypothetical protein [Pseudomonas aeruginosa]
MSVAQAISNRVKRMKKGKPFVRNLFAELGSRAAVDKALSRLVQSGCLERLTRGVYMRPKLSEYTCQLVKPSPLAIMNVLSKVNGETIQIHGAEAVRRLGLSTQMQVVPVYYTSGRTREIKAGNAVVRLNHVSSDRLQHAGNKVGLALTALYYLGKEGACPHALFKIADTLSPDELATLLACRMPKWMRAALAPFAEEASLAVSSGR